MLTSLTFACLFKLGTLSFYWETNSLLNHSVSVWAHIIKLLLYLTPNTIKTVFPRTATKSILLSQPPDIKLSIFRHIEQIYCVSAHMLFDWGESPAERKYTIFHLSTLYRHPFAFDQRWKKLTQMHRNGVITIRTKKIESIKVNWIAFDAIVYDLTFAVLSLTHKKFDLINYASVFNAYWLVIISW